jgi:hypothetical protein
MTSVWIKNMGVAYLTEHPKHIIERLPLDHPISGPQCAVMVGEHFSEPNKHRLGTRSGDYGRVA